MNDLEFNKAPRGHLETWSGLQTVAKRSMVAIIIVLALMALFLT